MATRDPKAEWIYTRSKFFIGIYPRRISFLCFGFPFLKCRDWTKSTPNPFALCIASAITVLGEGFQAWGLEDMVGHCSNSCLTKWFLGVDPRVFIKKCFKTFSEFNFKPCLPLVRQPLKSPFSSCLLARLFGHFLSMSVEGLARDWGRDYSEMLGLNLYSALLSGICAITFQMLWSFTL